MKAVLCPVCNGGGELRGELKYSVKDGIPVRIANPCHSCGGKGWVEVNEHISYSPETHEYIPFMDKCPACGGDRNSPGGTGCPMGSHYGSYCNI